MRLAIPVFVANPTMPFDQLYSALESAGLPEDVAGAVVEFVPLAFGRIALAGAGVRLPDEYRRIDTTGRERLRRRLADEPVFRAATEAAPEVMRQGEAAFLAVASRSAELRGVNQMLHNGSRAEDLVFAEPTMFWAEGMPESSRPRRPWWQFWG